MILAFINYEPLTYHNGSYSYPAWAQAIGWSITGGTILCIPGYAIFNTLRADGESFVAVCGFAISFTPLNFHLSISEIEEHN